MGMADQPLAQLAPTTPTTPTTPIVPLNATLAGAAEVQRLDVEAMHRLSPRPWSHRRMARSLLLLM